MYICAMMQQNPLYKGSLTTIILKMLSEHDKMYGYEITKKAREQSSGELVLTEGALYPALHKLEATGMLQVHVENIGNRQRKYYSLTKQGKKETAIKIGEVRSFIAQMQQMLNLKPTF